ncbi:hypothetical protein DFH09DRAFT_638078 [Mycena vulgaris]|nr:hypothetical protein DFH09DRAFT_638078 [Mycena vulgaris]
MQTFTFDSPKILKSAIYRKDDRFLQYITSTVKQGFSRHRTSLQDGAVRAEIDWRERTFEIAGVKVGVDHLKRKISNFSETRYWKWRNGEEYKVKYLPEEDLWMVTLHSGEAVAEFSTCLEYKPKTTPILHIAEDLQDSNERRFLLLVLLYSETRRLDRQD